MEQPTFAQIYKNIVKFLHPDTFFSENKAKTEDLLKRFNQINTQYKGTKLNSVSKKLVEKLYLEINKIDLSHKLKVLSEVEQLLNTYEAAIFKGEVLETPQIKDFKSTSKMIILIFDKWYNESQDSNTKTIIESIKSLISGLTSHGAKETLSETEIINLKNIFNNGGMFLTNQLDKLKIREKTEDQILEDFLPQLFGKVAATIRKSENPDVQKLHQALETLIQELQPKTQKTNNQKVDTKTSAEYVYTGYPKNTQINMTSNGIGINVSNGELKYTKIPKNASIQMNNGSIKYFVNGLISEEEAVSLGATKPRINENGTVSIGNNRFGGGNVYSGGNIHIGDVVGGVYSTIFDKSSVQEEVKEGARITQGDHIIDITKIKNLEKILGGSVTIKGTGKFNLDIISGGVVNI